MIQLRLPTDNHHVDLVANESAANVSFQVLGPNTEVAFVEELICQKFGSLKVSPYELFEFLKNDSWIKHFFGSVVLLRGDLNSTSGPANNNRFEDQPLGLKLVKAGILSQNELDRLLVEYEPFSRQQRFGEFLRLNLSVSAKVMEFLLNPLSSFEDGFNEKRLGERLVELGLVQQHKLDEALESQKTTGQRLGEILQEAGSLSPQAAQFFSDVQIDQDGCITTSGRIS